MKGKKLHPVGHARCLLAFASIDEQNKALDLILKT
jgi:hypothetical protein